MPGSLLFRLVTHVRRAVWNAMVHDVGLVSKAAAYSAIVSVFPAMLVLAAIVKTLPGADNLRRQIENVLGQILPDNATHLLAAYFDARTERTVAALIVASLISYLAASGVVVSLMEGFRRAYRVPHGAWKFKRQRLVALLLVPLTLMPLGLAAGLVIFGRIIAHSIAEGADHEISALVLFLWLILRWSLAMLTSVAMLTVIYHLSIPDKRSWRYALPGACLATALWFPSTLGFGWYVTRYANYAVVYGSLGAGIAMLVWLYIVCIAVIVGAEFNAELFPRHPRGSVMDKVESAIEAMRVE
jgi:membrane protein